MRVAFAQPSGSDPPLTYEVQIDGESFQVEGGHRPIKVQSKLKTGTTYTLALRVAMTQPLRLNSVQMEYGMWAKVIDNKGKDLRIAQIIHELGFSLEITDLGQALDAKRQDELLKTLVDDSVKRFTDRKATDLKQAEPKSRKSGSSEGKSVEIKFQRLRWRGMDLHGLCAIGGEIYRQCGCTLPGPRQGGRATLGDERLEVDSPAAVGSFCRKGPIRHAFRQTSRF